MPSARNIPAATRRTTDFNSKKENHLTEIKIMDYKKSKAPNNTVTRNIMDLCKETGNIYESVAIIG